LPEASFVCSRRDATMRSRTSRTRI
jgi:hypothetical protein